MFCFAKPQLFPGLAASLCLFALFLLLGLAQSKQATSLVEQINERFTKPNSRIVNGLPVPDGKRLFQIALLRRGRFICGGSLVDKRFVVTAGHCVDGGRARQYQVRYGTHKFTDGPTVRVRKLFVHPHYSGTRVVNDIAVLMLHSPILDNPEKNVQYVPLNVESSVPEFESRNEGDQQDQNSTISDTTTVEPPEVSTESEVTTTTTTTAAPIYTTVTVSGWGKTARNQTISEQLLWTNLSVVSLEDCRKSWRPYFEVSEGMICAANVDSSACNGDSGGPLTWNDQLAGVVSLGSPNCHSDQLPNVYTDIYYYRDWINTIIMQKSLEPEMDPIEEPEDLS